MAEALDRTMRVLLLHHPYTYPRYEQDFVDRVAELPQFDVVPANLEALGAGVLASKSGPVALTEYDAVVVFVAFTRLRAAPTLDWRGFSGLRVLMDNDIIQNYSDIFDPTLGGAWPPVFRRHRFHSIVTSGGVVRERLEADGIPADWVPKGFEPARFVDEGRRRKGVVTFGSAYTCRQVAERAITDARLPLTRLDTTPYLRLGAKLNRFLGCLAVSSDLEVPLNQRGALRTAVARDVPIRPGLEPMAKLFEGAGAGCCPIADAMEDLAALGFRDGESAITFRTHAELVDKLRAALETPDNLRAMGSAAGRLAHAEHTWARRAETLRDVIVRRLGLT
jgi:hypothetical protein